jgi:hypothetical protein
MNKKAKVWGLFAIITAVAFTAGAAIISDAFDDGNIGTNANGDGSGFSKVGNTVAFTATESGGTLQIREDDGTDAAKNIGAMSKDAFNVLTQDPINVTWDVDRCGWRNDVVTGYQWVLGNGTITPAGFNDGLMIQIDKDNNLNVYGYGGGVSHTLLSTTLDVAFSVSQTQGFIIDLAIDKTAFSGSGNWTLNIFEGATTYYSSTKNFNDGSGTTISSYFAADTDVTVGWGFRSTDSVNEPYMTMNSVTVIPEPAALGLIAIGGGGILFFRRLLKK